MPAKSNLTIANLRTDGEGIRGSFEEFCCQLFRRTAEVPAKSQYRRIRGAGGDGGVEATWTFPDETVWGLQAKFFGKLGTSEKAQLTESVRQAAANYPSLTHYTICLPFNLTARKGARTGRPMVGQHEKFSAWVGEWEDEFIKAGRTIEFDLWAETELRGRLAAADPSGGLTRYWFEKEALSRIWFDQRLREAKAQAGQRYSPKLTIDTPLNDTLQAFGCSEVWISKVESLRDDLAEKLEWWGRTGSGSGKLLGDAPSKFAAQAKELFQAAEPIEDGLGQTIENPAVLGRTSFRRAIRLSIATGSALEPVLKESLLKTHGRSADSPGFRQFRAEYYADFPMAPLDHLRGLLSVLAQVEHLVFGPEGDVPLAPVMLLRGQAGIGKTHGIVDAAGRRSDLGLFSAVLFGEDVSGTDPWNSIADKLGLGSARGRDSMLDALNAAGEASGFPLIIFIDALNETQPDRRVWQSWLPPMVEQIKIRPFLKLCVSCRDSYLREVMPTIPELPAGAHNGFMGQEYEAQFAFFQFFGLGVPAEPLLQDDFSNPLFLRLVCEALRVAGAQAVPVGREGIRSIIDLLIRAKNKRAAALCDYDHRENRVSTAMLRLAGAMAAAGGSHLALANARALIDESATAQSKSLFGVLEGESLITVVERPAASLGGEPDYSVRFTFERIGDHLIAEYLLSKVEDVEKAFEAGGPLHFLTQSWSATRANAGLLEALSIQLPETHNVELVDALKDFDDLSLNSFIASLQWRNPAHISGRTRQLVMDALGSNDRAAMAFEAILILTVRPEHPLNAAFLDQLLRRFPMLARDPFWATMMETSYSNWGDRVIPRSGIHRLIDTARRARLETLPDDVGTLWATALAWFCVSPDRRIRDRATMALVSIFRARPAIIVGVIRKFIDCEDEYVSERVLVAGYGALLLHQSKPHLQETAGELYRRFFAKAEPPINASLRDHARLIVELAVELGVSPLQLKTDRYRPPHSSPWPINLPSEEDITRFAVDRERFPQMQLVQQVGLATGTDFARYIVEPRVVNAFDIQSAGLDKLGLFRWFLSEAVKLGYPGPHDQCAKFDRNLLVEFGGGRGKPGWVERLGKKYYWIFLRQLVGQLSDHVGRKGWSGTVRVPSDDLQGLDLRDIDPTDVRMFARDIPEDDGWLTPFPYVFGKPDTPKDDAAWIVENDLPDIGAALILCDSSGDHWHGLDLPATWRGKRIDRKIKSYRYVSRSILTLTCRATDTGRVKKAFGNGSVSLFGHEPHDYRGYLGEYPRRWPYRSREIGLISFSVRNAGIDFDFVGLRQLRGREWGRDYSLVTPSPSLLMPSIDLIKAGDLHWDGRGSWLDDHGDVQVMDPWWWNDKGPGLIIRLEYLDGFLKEKGKALVIIGFQTKFIAGMSAGPGRIEENTLFIRSKGQTKLVDRTIEHG